MSLPAVPTAAMPIALPSKYTALERSPAALRIPNPPPAFGHLPLKRGGCVGVLCDLSARLERDMQGEGANFLEPTLYK